MKDIDDPLKIVIVRDMWLTGTDIPCLHTLYIDKPMKGHTLMQAIARVNRIFRDKPGGFVVDFIGIGDQLKEATKKYTQGGGRGNPAPNINEEAKEAFLAALARCAICCPSAAARPTATGVRSPTSNSKIYFSTAAAISPKPMNCATTSSRRKRNSIPRSRWSIICLTASAMRTKWCSTNCSVSNCSRPSPAVPEGRKEIGVVRDLLDRSIESKGVVDIFQAAGHRESGHLDSR